MEAGCSCAIDLSPFLSSSSSTSTLISTSIPIRRGLMSINAALSFTPTILYRRPFTRHKFLKPNISFHHKQIPPSLNTFSLPRHISATPVWRPKPPMTELVRIPSSPRLKSSDGGVEGFRGLEEEAILVDGSTDLSSDFASGAHESTLNRLSKWIVAILFGVVILWRRDAETMWILMGAVTNAVLSISLKRIFKQERPISTVRSDPGMPSSHAQSIFYAVFSAILTLVQDFGMNEATLIAGVLTLAFGIYLSWLRVSEQFHTASQVVVGAIVGSVFSILWFKSWDAFVLKFFISYLWARIFVVVGSVAFSLGFILYVIQYWLVKELV